MFDSLFGAGTPLTVRFFIAFVVVFGLIGLAAWLVRRFGADRLGGPSARGRQPRLAVIEASAVDGRRRLVLIRRDNVEHLLMIGGPTDLVVEPNIVRAQAAGTREITPARAADTLPRPVPLGEPSPSWPAPSEPAPRPQRHAAAEETVQWSLPAQPDTPRRRAAPDTLAGLAAELSKPGGEPVIPNGRHAPLQPAETPSTADQNLADMAHRLEAVLRRPGAAPERPAANKPTSPASKPAAPQAAREEKTEQPENVYGNLEQEMASLLGRQPGKS